ASNNARPPLSDPVNPTALVAGRCTSLSPISLLDPCTIEKTPAGIPVASAAAWIARPTSSDVPGCAGCAFTTTGLPAASADAVSPPPTEYASGKLLAPNTTTGPNGTSIRRRSGFGKGLRSGIARSIVASTHDPSRTTSANIL